ncbi:hypothetical protein TNCV_3472301 [Trichonephila clavipes]|nr:hypothetical protein TNCV_3472301 [Trichonephila clavipes]
MLVLPSNPKRRGCGENLRFYRTFRHAHQVKPFDRGNKINQCWRCQGVVSLLRGVPPPSLAVLNVQGPTRRRTALLTLNDPMKCANCSGAHAANWSWCPKHPKNSKKKNLAKINKTALSQIILIAIVLKILIKNNLRRHLDLIFQRREKSRAYLDYSKVVKIKPQGAC